MIARRAFIGLLSAAAAAPFLPAFVREAAERKRNEWDEMVTFVIRSRRQALQDNITANNALIERLKKLG